jgi:hypothetical protein
MIDIPEITAEQLTLITGVCSDVQMGVFSQCDPVPGDALIDATLAVKARRDAERLVELGFLRNITEDHREQIDKQNAATGRVWTVFAVTPLARAVFQATLSNSIN